MAERYVFVSKDSYPYYEKIYVNLDWFGGHSLSQKRKCEIGLNQNFLSVYPDKKHLEISGASLISLGNELSAMNLKKNTAKGITSVESAFQSSRIYSNEKLSIGPFPECLFLSGKESKKYVKQISGGMICSGYLFDGMNFFIPLHHVSLFYDFLYLNALLEEENKSVAKKLINAGYDSFSDLATLSQNTQARSAAIFIGLHMAGKLEKVKKYETYLELFRTTLEGVAVGPNAYDNVQLLDSKGKEKPLSPIVPCVFHKEQVEQYYNEHCYMLTNKKDENNYLDKFGIL